MFKKAIGLVVLFAASTASAVPIQYDWSGTTNDNSWSATGFIVIDDSQYGFTLTDPTNEFLDWMFSWTDGTVTYVNSASNGDAFNASFSAITTLIDGTIVSGSLCTQSCLTADHPVIAINISGSLWNATTPAGLIIADDSQTIGTFSPGQPAAVQEPTSLALIGAGVIAFGVRRRKKRTVGEKCLTF